MANCKCPEGSAKVTVPCRRIVVFNPDSESESPCPCILPKAVDASKGLAVILNGRKSQTESLLELSLEERCSQQNLITCVNPSGQRPYHYSLLINGASSVYVINCTGAKCEDDELRDRVEQIISRISKAYGGPTGDGVKSFVYILRKKKLRIQKPMPLNVVAECITSEELKARLMESAKEMLNTPDDDLTTPAGLTDMHRLEVNDGDQLRKLGDLLSVKATLDKKMRILRLLFDFGAVLYNIREEASNDLLIANSSYLYQMLSDARKKHNRIRGVVDLISIGSEESYDNILDHHDQIGELLSELDLVLKVREKQYVFIHTLPLSTEAPIPCTTDPLLVVYEKHGSSEYYPAGVNVLIALVQAFAKQPNFELDYASQGRYYLNCRDHVAGILCIWLEPQKPIMIAFRQGDATFGKVQTLPSRIHKKCNEIYDILKKETSKIDDQLLIVFECDIHSSCVAKFKLVGGDCNLRCLCHPLCSTTVPWKKRIWHDCPDNKTLTVKFNKFWGELKDVDDTHHSDSGPLNGRKRPAATSGTTEAKKTIPSPGPDLEGRPSREDLTSISRETGLKWKDLLRSLDVKEAKIDTLIANNPNNTEEACYQGLLFWENENALKPVTWGTLTDALEKAELTKLANELLQKVNLQLQQQDPSPMLSDQRGSGKPPADYRPPASTKTDASIPYISSVETFMEHFKEDFLNSKDVDPMAIVGRLEDDKLMPVAKCSQVKSAFDPYNKRATIYRHMRDQGTYSTLLGLCKAMKAASANDKTIALGERMQKVLKQNRYNFPKKEQA